VDRKFSGSWELSAKTNDELYDPFIARRLANGEPFKARIIYDPRKALILMADGGDLAAQEALYEEFGINLFS
jgi:hypothetical protein